MSIRNITHGFGRRSTLGCGPQSIAIAGDFPVNLDTGCGDDAPATVGTVGDVAAVAGVGILAIGLVVGATAGVGALVGMGVAAAVSGDKRPNYKKGAAIGAGAGILAGIIL
jgi:hypothetical protein